MKRYCASLISLQSLKKEGNSKVIPCPWIHHFVKNICGWQCPLKPMYKMFLFRMTTWCHEVPCFAMFFGHMSDSGQSQLWQTHPYMLTLVRLFFYRSTEILRESRECGKILKLNEICPKITSVSDRVETDMTWFVHLNHSGAHTKLINFATRHRHRHRHHI